MFVNSWQSPVGRLKLVASENGLVAILWENDNPRRVVLGDLRHDDRQPVLIETERQLKEYFEGKRQGFSIPLDIRGTPFQKSVWDALLAIPFGETRSYGQIAKQLGRPSAVRAVGNANGRNPLSIVVPCHRVIGSSGKLTGFAGGLEAKAHLLKIDRKPAHKRHTGAGQYAQFHKDVETNQVLFKLVASLRRFYFLKVEPFVEFIVRLTVDLDIGIDEVIECWAILLRRQCDVAAGG